MGAPGGGSPNSRGYPGCTAAPTPRLPAGSRGRAGNVPSVLLDSAFPHGGQPQPPLLQKQWEGRLGDLAKSTCSGGSALMPPQPQNSCLSSARASVSGSLAQHPPHQRWATFTRPRPRSKAGSPPGSGRTASLSRWPARAWTRRWQGCGPRARWKLAIGTGWGRDGWSL